jgi:C_GCAxxG_C_C family probable redox protein
MDAIYLRRETMKTKSEIATEIFLNGYNCAQSVLYTFRGESALEEDTALKIACGLGAGMGRKQEVCGAVTGGILVLGMRHGRGSKDERSAMELTYAKTRELMDCFAGRHGSCMCKLILDGCDLATEAGQKQFKGSDMLNNVCKPCVQTVVEILENEQTPSAL